MLQRVHGIFRNTVNSNNPNRIAIGWRQFDTTNSNFRQSGVSYSTNGGLSWTYPGNLDPGVFRSDPVLAADSTGGFWYLSLLQSFFDDMWKSLTGGTTYTKIAAARDEMLGFSWSTRVSATAPTEPSASPH